MDIEGIGPLSERIDGSLGRIQARITSWRQTGAIRCVDMNNTWKAGWGH
jgi:hypothetical protein